MKILKLNDIFPNWNSDTSQPIAGGFFRQLYEFFSDREIECQWLSSEDKAYMLDLTYHGNHSGQKPIAPLPRNMLGEDGNLTSYTAKLIVSAFYAMYGKNLDKQYRTMFIEYNPIDNYNMTETATDATTGSGTESRTESGTNTHTGTIADSHTGTITDAHSGTITDAHSGTITDETEEIRNHNIYGFDSAAMNPADNDNISTDSTRTLSNADTKTLANSETKTLANTDTRTHNDTVTESKTDSTEKENESTTTHELTRSGNIGVTTTQQMLQSERDLWEWNFYNNFLFPCADRVLTLPIY